MTPEVLTRSFKLRVAGLFLMLGMSFGVGNSFIRISFTDRGAYLRVFSKDAYTTVYLYGKVEMKVQRVRR